MANDFKLLPKRYFLNGENLEVTLGISSDSGQVADLVVVDDLTKASFTANGTLKPISQTFNEAGQEVTFVIPVYLPHDKPLNYEFTGTSNINGYRVEYQTTVVVNPISVTVTELFTDGDNLNFQLVSERSDTAEPIQVLPEVMISDFSYKEGSGNFQLVSENLAEGQVNCIVTMTNPPVKDLELFIVGLCVFKFPTYQQSIGFSRRDRATEAWKQFPEPLVNYAVKNMWGNPELDSQYQLKLARLTGATGWVGYFFHAGKSWSLPSEGDFYQIYALGGLSANYWNMFNQRNDWYPRNKWVRASEIAYARGVALDVYSSKGYLFPRSETFIMNTFEGHTLVAFPMSQHFKFPLNEKMYIRCYSTDINTDNISQANQMKWRFGYFTREYTKAQDWLDIQNRYNVYNSFGMGSLKLVVNGVVTKYEGYTPAAGDVIEIYYDPSVFKEVAYSFPTLNDFYSTLDQKRKLLLFPAFKDKPRVYSYFDDCDFYVHNKRTGKGLYYHRNREDAIRQLTHQDYSLASSYVEFLISQLIEMDTSKKSTEADMEIRVFYRRTKWVFPVGPNVSRINDLYLLEDPAQILQAMVGTNATVEAWSAPKLEESTTNFVLNAVFQQLSTESVRNALGYNGCSEALSSSPLYMCHILPGDPNRDDSIPSAEFVSGRGYRIPASYVETSTAYEYDKDGLLLRNSYIQNRECYMPGEGCWFVEFVVGKSSTWLDYEISRQDVVLKPGYGFRVYKAGWLIDPTDPELPTNDLFKNEFDISHDGTDRYPEPTELRIYKTGENQNDNVHIPSGKGRPDGKWVDVTNTDEYRIVNGVVVWNFDTTNHVGMVVFDTTHLYNEFELKHIDNSIWFTLTHTWDVGGVPLSIEPGQVDVWCNRHPLIENVDYILDFPVIYITSKMWLKEGGKNTFAYRARGLSKDGIIPSSELGFVQSGCIGFNGRYNLRIDRPTRTIINGRLYLTNQVDWAENIDHGDNMRVHNGRPYEVKHIYCANKYVDQYDLYWGFAESRKLDAQIVDYLTEYVRYKPEVDPEYPYLEKDKYRMFSPFLSQLANEMVLGFLRVPKRDDTKIGYTDRAIDELTKPYQWLLKYDPVIKQLDDRFFSYQPYSNLERLALTPDQLTVIGRVNDLYLKGKIHIEGFFDVIENV